MTTRDKRNDLVVDEVIHRFDQFHSYRRGIYTHKCIITIEVVISLFVQMVIYKRVKTMYDAY